MNEKDNSFHAEQLKENMLVLVSFSDPTKPEEDIRGYAVLQRKPNGFTLDTASINRLSTRFEGLRLTGKADVRIHEVYDVPDGVHSTYQMDPSLRKLLYKREDTQQELDLENYIRNATSEKGDVIYGRQRSEETILILDEEIIEAKHREKELDQRIKALRKMKSEVYDGITIEFK